jgi:hypothetical protein
MPTTGASLWITAGLLLTSGCAGAAQPPSPPPAPPIPSAAPAVVTPTSASASAAPHPAPPPPSPPAIPSLPEPLPPLTRRLATLKLPGIRGAVYGVSGTSAREVWFLSDDEDPGKRPTVPTIGMVYRTDGRRAIQRYTPACYGALFRSIQAGRDGVVLEGTNPYQIPYPSTQSGILRAGARTWECERAYTRTRIATADVAWTLRCPTPSISGCLLRSADRKVAPPVFHASYPDGGTDAVLDLGPWQMVGDADGWMVLLGARPVVAAGVSPPEAGNGQLLRYNGVTWTFQAPLPASSFTGIWSDGEGRVWLTRSDGAPIVFDGKKAAPIAVPASFAATGVVGTGPKDVWFFGSGRVVYQWDGERLRRGEAPFEVGDAWAEPGGEVWLVPGYDTDKDQGKGEKGVVARTAGGPR